MTERKRITVSHLTISQAARFLGVAVPTAHERLRPLATLEHGTWMVSADVVRQWYRDRVKANRSFRTFPHTGTMHP